LLSEWNLGFQTYLLSIGDWFLHSIASREQRGAERSAHQQ